MSDADTGASAPGYTMSSITGKLALALVRGDDYAHAGEEEAIELVLGPLPKAAANRLLDVGCGIGGTARYVAAHGWGDVTGVDIDPDNIAAASTRHPEQRFVCSDAAHLGEHLRGPFDVLYSFNAFFLFADQPAALRAMRGVAGDGATLAIFDYVDRGDYVAHQARLARTTRRRALGVDRMQTMLEDSGWTPTRVAPAHEDYLRWYDDLVERVTAKRDAIVAQSSTGFYEFMLRNYSEMRDDIRTGHLGGATFYASAAG